jgi:Zn-dependent alcohol dehydrogenase
MRTPTRGAVVRQAPGKYEVMDLLVDDPLDNEVQVKLVASGLCHSGANLLAGKRFSGSDTPILVTPNGTAVTQMTALATFTELITVSADSIVKVDDDVPPTVSTMSPRATRTCTTARTSAASSSSTDDLAGPCRRVGLTLADYRAREQLDDK